eukprot:150587-Pyramimonas_sp.AAC.1
MIQEKEEGREDRRVEDQCKSDLHQRCGDNPYRPKPPHTSLQAFLPHSKTRPLERSTPDGPAMLATAPL